MQAIVGVKALQDAVKAAAKIAGGHQSMPILHGVKVSANGNGLVMDSTDLETWAHVVAGGAVKHDDGPDAVIVSGVTLAAVAANLPKGEGVDLEATDDMPGFLTVNGATLPTMPLEDFPERRASGERLALGSLTGVQYKALVKRLKATALKAGETTRLQLTAAHIVRKVGALTFEACNGYRLLRETYHEAGDVEAEILVSAACLQKFAALVKAGDTVSLGLLAGDIPRLEVSFSSAVYSIATIAGEEFPDTERVIPKDTYPSATEITVNRAELARLVKAAEATAPDDSGAVSLTLEAGAVTVSSFSRNRGEYSADVAASVKFPEDITPEGDTARGVCTEISFRGEYIRDALNGSKSEEMRLTLTGPERAGRLDPVTPEAFEQLWVVMPVRLRDS